MHFVSRSVPSTTLVCLSPSRFPFSVRTCKYQSEALSQSGALIEQPGVGYKVFLTTAAFFFKLPCPPSKHAGSDPEVFWLRPVMAITASVQPESGRLVHVPSDFPHSFQLRFSKEGTAHIVQNRPRSSLDGLVRVWPNASV